MIRLRRPFASLWARFARDESATTSIEYALIASFVSIVIIGAVASTGTNVKTLFNNVSTALAK